MELYTWNNLLFGLKSKKRGWFLTICLYMTSKTQERNSHFAKDEDYSMKKMKPKLQIPDVQY